jgi:hypothetical protein
MTVTITHLDKSTTVQGDQGQNPVTYAAGSSLPAQTSTQIAQDAAVRAAIQSNVQAAGGVTAADWARSTEARGLYLKSQGRGSETLWQAVPGLGGSTQFIKTTGDLMAYSKEQQALLYAKYGTPGYTNAAGQYIPPIPPTGQYAGSSTYGTQAGRDLYGASTTSAKSSFEGRGAVSGDSYEAWVARNTTADPYANVKGADVNAQAAYYKAKYPKVNWAEASAAAFIGQQGLDETAKAEIQAKYASQPDIGNANIALLGARMEAGEFVITQRELGDIIQKDIGKNESVSRMPTTDEIREWTKTAQQSGYTVVDNSGKPIETTVEVSATLTSPKPTPARTMSAISRATSDLTAGLRRVEAGEGYVPSPYKPGRGPTQGAPTLGLVGRGETFTLAPASKYTTTTPTRTDITFNPFTPKETTNWANVSPDLQDFITKFGRLPKPAETIKYNIEDTLKLTDKGIITSSQYYDPQRQDTTVLPSQLQKIQIVDENGKNIAALPTFYETLTPAQMSDVAKNLQTEGYTVKLNNDGTYTATRSRTEPQEIKQSELALFKEDRGEFTRQEAARDTAALSAKFSSVISGSGLIATLDEDSRYISGKLFDTSTKSWQTAWTGKLPDTRREVNIGERVLALGASIPTAYYGMIAGAPSFAVDVAVGTTTGLFTLSNTRYSEYGKPIYTPSKEYGTEKDWSPAFTSLAYHGGEIGKGFVTSAIENPIIGGTMIIGGIKAIKGGKAPLRAPEIIPETMPRVTWGGKTYVPAKMGKIEFVSKAFEAATEIGPNVAIKAGAGARARIDAAKASIKTEINEFGTIVTDAKITNQELVNAIFSKGKPLGVETSNFLETTVKGKSGASMTVTVGETPYRSITESDFTTTVRESPHGKLPQITTQAEGFINTIISESEAPKGRGTSAQLQTEQYKTSLTGEYEQAAMTLEKERQTGASIQAHPPGQGRIMGLRGTLTDIVRDLGIKSTKDYGFGGRVTRLAEPIYSTSGPENIGYSYDLGTRAIPFNVGGETLFKAPTYERGFGSYGETAIMRGTTKIGGKSAKVIARAQTIATAEKPGMDMIDESIYHLKGKPFEREITPKLNPKRTRYSVKYDLAPSDYLDPFHAPVEGKIPATRGRMKPWEPTSQVESAKSHSISKNERTRVLVSEENRPLARVDVLEESPTTLTISRWKAIETRKGYGKELLENLIQDKPLLNQVQGNGFTQDGLRNIERILKPKGFKRTGPATFRKNLPNLPEQVKGPSKIGKITIKKTPIGQSYKVATEIHPEKSAVLTYKSIVAVDTTYTKSGIFERLFKTHKTKITGLASQKMPEPLVKQLAQTRKSLPKPSATALIRGDTFNYLPKDTPKGQWKPMKNFGPRPWEPKFTKTVEKGIHSTFEVTDPYAQPDLSTAVEQMSGRSEVLLQKEPVKTEAKQRATKADLKMAKQDLQNALNSASATVLGESIPIAIKQAKTLYTRAKAQEYATAGRSMFKIAFAGTPYSGMHAPSTYEISTDLSNIQTQRPIMRYSVASTLSNNKGANIPLPPIFTPPGPAITYRPREVSIPPQSISLSTTLTDESSFTQISGRREQQPPVGITYTNEMYIGDFKLKQPQDQPPVQKQPPGDDTTGKEDTGFRYYYGEEPPPPSPPPTFFTPNFKFTSGPGGGFGLPLLPPPSLGGSWGPALPKQERDRRLRTKYSPSLVAVELGLTTDKPIQGMFTGAEIRYLPSWLMPKRAQAPRQAPAPKRSVPNMKQIYGAIGGFRAPKARRKKR